MAPDRGYVLHAVSWPLLSICAILTALRFYVRTRIIQSVGWDDAFILLALVCATLNTALVIVSVHYGSGQHSDTLPAYERSQAIKYQVLSQGFHVMSTNWGKVSVALFLVRVISKARNHVRGMVALIVVMCVVNVACVVTIYAQCQPTAKLWDFGRPGKCWPEGSQKKYAIFQSSASAFTDLVLAIYPLLTIKDLQMAPKVKAGLGGLLSLGIIAMVAAIVKTTYLPDLTSYDDYTWTTVDLTIWVALEEYLIILAANIPALPPLFHIIVRHRSSKRPKSTPIEPLEAAAAAAGGTILESASRSRPRSTSKPKPNPKRSRSRGHNRIIGSLTGGSGFIFSSHSRSQSASASASHSYSYSNSRYSPYPAHHHNYSQSQYQAYVPFASVGRDYVEYPLTWTNSKPGPGSEEGGEGGSGSGNDSRSGNGSDSEVPINGGGFGSEPQSPHGILRTTEFRIKEVSKAVYDT